MHSAASTGHTHQGMILIWVSKMAGQGLECGKIKEIYAFFLGKVPLTFVFALLPVKLIGKITLVSDLCLSI